MGQFISTRFQEEPNSVLAAIIADESQMTRLEPGSHDNGPEFEDAIRQVQQALLDLGWLMPPLALPYDVARHSLGTQLDTGPAPALADGKYGAITEAVVKTFKTVRDIRFPLDDPNGTLDGLCGFGTLSRIDFECSFLDEGAPVIDELAASVEAAMAGDAEVNQRAQADTLGCPLTPHRVEASGVGGAMRAFRNAAGVTSAIVFDKNAGASGFAFLVRGALLQEYLLRGGPGGSLGMPTSSQDPFILPPDVPAQPVCPFQNGTLQTQADGSVVQI